MPRKKSTSVLKTSLPKPKATPPKKEVVVPESKLMMTTEKPKTRSWPTAPTFPPEQNYYDAEKIEQFRREYKAFLEKYEGLVK